MENKKKKLKLVKVCPKNEFIGKAKILSYKKWVDK